MDLKAVRRGKEIILEVTSLLTLAQACIAILLVEFWGLEKIWNIITH